MRKAPLPVLIVAWSLMAAVIVHTFWTDEPEAAPVAPPAAVAPDPDAGWRTAAGHLEPGVELFFGRFDKIPRGRVVRFMHFDDGDIVVLDLDGKIELVPRHAIAVGDWWIREQGVKP